MRSLDIASVPRKRLVAIGLAVVVISFVVGYTTRPRPLHEHAQILFQAILEEDGATILRYVHPVERELNDLTPETTAAIVSEMINARYEDWGWTPEGGYGAHALDRYSGVFTQRGRIPGVGRVSRSIEVLRVEGRPTFLLSHELGAAMVEEGKWKLRREGRGLEAFTATARKRTLIAALDKDEKRLRELGFRYNAGLNREAGEFRFIYLSDLRTTREDWLSDPEALKRPNPYESHPFAVRHARLWMTADQALAHKQQRARGR